MTFWTLIRRSLRYHAGAHLGVVLGAAIGSAALVGALVVGDSVRATLRERALQRVDNIGFAVAPPGRLFRAALAEDFQRGATNASGEGVALPVCAPVLRLAATASTPTGEARANAVTVLGVTPAFEPLAGGRGSFSKIAPDGVLLNAALARQLRAAKGDTILLRISRPSAFSAETPLAPRSDVFTALRLRVADIVPAAALGNFSLAATQTEPFNAFVALGTLQDESGATNRANLLLSTALPANALAELKRLWTLDDLELRLRTLPDGSTLELSSARVFLNPAVIQAATAAGGQGVLTYLANLLRAGTNATPYSMVTAAGPPYVPAGMSDDEVLVNQWLAEDLALAPGAALELTAFDPASGARLVETTNRFRLREVVPMQQPWGDRTLLPEFPGIQRAESTHDWDAGFPLVHTIRPKDEAYWKTYRGTPKAFITLAAGQKLWANRFGSLTSIRFPVRTNIPSPAAYAAALAKELLAALNPAEFGFRFEPVREQALAAAAQAQDFGQLFLGFSFFLVLAALLLMGLLFQFGLEQRASEIGTLLALGFAPGRVRRLLLLEGAALALVGGLAGTAGGLGYARAMLWGLATVWRDAVGAVTLQFQVTAATLIAGAGASVVVATLTIWLTLRKQAGQPAIALLAGAAPGERTATRSRGKWVGLVAGASATGLVAWALASGERANAEIFFSAGLLSLVSGLAFAAAWLARLAGKSISAGLTLGGLGARGCARRRKRSLATIALLGCGAFVVSAIGVFRLEAERDATQRSSGTGGFALLGQATLPVVQDLNSAAGREFFGLSAADLADVQVVALRVHEGDEASCLNLNHARTPRLLGVKPELLAGRFTFTEWMKHPAGGRGWEPLMQGRASVVEGTPLPASTPDTRRSVPDAPEIPAIGDANSIQWALGKKVGDTLDYTDERGHTFKLRLVGAVANSVLQGNLLIDEAAFLEKFPSETGYRRFLLDAPANSAARVAAALTRALADAGLEVTPAVERLAAFNAVQNTYLGTFQVLGGLGLLLGSAGLGAVVLRNVLERRGELALLLAVGFRRRTLQWLVLGEHAVLLLLGLGLGLFSAGVAVLPALLTPGGHLPAGSLSLTLGAVLVNGGLWTWVATRRALRGDLLAALRNE